MIKHNVLTILLFFVFLGMIFLFFRIESIKNQPKVIGSDTTRKIEVHYHHHDSSVIQLPKTTNSITPIYIPQQYQPDTSSLHALRLQYEDLVKRFLTKNVKQDTLKIDSLGYVAVTDTVKENDILSRKYQYSIKERVITNTITITNTVAEKKRNILYVGPGITGNQKGPNGGNLVVLLKNKKDNISGISGGIQNINNTIQPQFGIFKLWKISLKD